MDCSGDIGLAVWAVIYEAQGLVGEEHIFSAFYSQGEKCLLGPIGSDNPRCTVIKVWITQVLFFSYITSQKRYRAVQNQVPNPRGLRAKKIYKVRLYLCRTFPLANTLFYYDHFSNKN